MTLFIVKWKQTLATPIEAETEAEAIQALKDSSRLERGEYLSLHERITIIDHVDFEAKEIEKHKGLENGFWKGK